MHMLINNNLLITSLSLSSLSTFFLSKSGLLLSLSNSYLFGGTRRRLDKFLLLNLSLLSKVSSFSSYLILLFLISSSDLTFSIDNSALFNFNPAIFAFP